MSDLTGQRWIKLYTLIRREPKLYQALSAARTAWPEVRRSDVFALFVESFLWAAELAPTDGNLGEIEPGAFEESLGWEGPLGSGFDALAHAGWLVRNELGGWSVCVFSGFGFGPPLKLPSGEKIKKKIKIKNKSPVRAVDNSANPPINEDMPTGQVGDRPVRKL